jgi:hypothetical protein
MENRYDQEEVLKSEYVNEFLHENSYERFQNAGTTLVFHRNSGAFVIDGSNKHFKEWVSKKPEALQGSIKRRIHGKIVGFSKSCSPLFSARYYN